MLLDIKWDGIAVSTGEFFLFLWYYPRPITKSYSLTSTNMFLLHIILTCSLLSHSSVTLIKAIFCIRYTLLNAISLKFLYTITWLSFIFMSLLWRHNGLDGVSNHQPHDCLLNHSFRRRSKKTSKLRLTGLLRGIHRWPVNSPYKWPVTRKIFQFDDVIMCHVYLRQIVKRVWICLP